MTPLFLAHCMAAPVAVLNNPVKYPIALKTQLIK